MVDTLVAASWIVILAWCLWLPCRRVYDKRVVGKPLDQPKDRVLRVVR